MLLASSHRDGANKTMLSVKKKRVDGFDLYVDTTGDFRREGLEINWVVAVRN